MKSSNSIIFINNNNNYNKKKSFIKDYFLYFQVSPLSLAFRILSSLMPPLLSMFHHVHVDLLGPSLAILILGAILSYGQSYQFMLSESKSSPTQVVLTYACVMPILTFFLSRLGKSRIKAIEIVSLLGYSLYGHIFTLLVSLIFYHETSDKFFFFCLMIFGGLSAFRIVLVLLTTISVPIGRLLVCSCVASLHLLFLMFVHFTFMHKTFVYGRSV